MRGQAPCTTDLSEEVCVIAASTKSAAQCPSDVISICLQIAPTTPADPLLCFISMWAAVGGAVLLRRPKSMWNSAPALGLWGQRSVWRLLLPAVSSILSLHGTELETPHGRGKVRLVKYGPAEEEEGIWGTSTLGQWATTKHGSHQRAPSVLGTSLMCQCQCYIALVQLGTYLASQCSGGGVLPTASEDGRCNSLMLTNLTLFLPVGSAGIRILAEGKL